MKREIVGVALVVVLILAATGYYAASAGDGRVFVAAQGRVVAYVLG